MLGLLSKEELTEVSSLETIPQLVRTSLSDLRLMSDGAEDLDGRQHAAALLVALSEQFHGREAIVDQNGTEVLVSILRAESDFSTLVLCMRTLRQLTDCPRLALRVGPDLAEKGIASPLIALLASTSTHVQLRIEAAACASKLCETEPARWLLVEAQVVTIAMEMIQQACCCDEHERNA